MATPRQQQSLNNVVSLVTTLSNFDPGALVQKDRLGSDLCFESWLSLFVDITSTAKQLLKLNFENVPYGVLQSLHGPLNNINNTLNQIGAFSPASQGNAIQTRDRLATELEDYWNAIYMTIRTLLGGRMDDGAQREIDGLVSQMKVAAQLSSDALSALNSKKEEVERSLVAFMAEKASEFTQIGEKKLQDVEAALDEVRKAANEAGVSQTATYFKEEAGEHLDSAENWMRVLFILVVVLVLFSLFGAHLMASVGLPEPAPGSASVVQITYFTQKGLIVFALLFALMWASKNYGAARHNYVVNKHRSNALGSFQAFAAGAVDADTKSAVLIQATQAIFAPQASGYVKTDGDNSPSSPIIEILRSVGQRDK